MAAPALKVRYAVLKRDQYRCAACGVYDDLQFQHRKAVGMGGSKRRPSPVEGLTLCAICNGLVEGPLQVDAFARGWKLRQFADPVLVPVYYAWCGLWTVLEGDLAVPIFDEEAVAMMGRVYGEEFDEWMNHIEA